MIYFIESKYEKIKIYKNEGFYGEKDIEIYNNLLNDDYLSDENYTLGQIMGNLTLENVRIFFFYLFLFYYCFSIISLEKIF